MMTITSSMSMHTVLAHLQQRFATIYADEHIRTQYAWWILEHCTGASKATLLLNNFKLTQEQCQALNTLVDELTINHKPLQYLIGSVPFNDLTILIEPPILIPRPETESWSWDLGQQLQPLRDQKLTILDLCCGSGCIALTLAHALPNAHIYAIDIQQKATALTLKNAQHNAITNITAVTSDLFEQLPNDIRFDLIVANPPYIAYEEKQELDASVVAWEDPQALFAADQGLDILKKIIVQAPQWLKKSSPALPFPMAQVVLEIGYRQKTAVVDLLYKSDYTSVTVHKDLQGNDRTVYARI